MTGVDKDLATLHDLIGTAGTDAQGAALARVEAELSRLREQRDAIQRKWEAADEHIGDLGNDLEAAEARYNLELGRAQDAEGRLFTANRRAVAAEARCARLQQALEAIANNETPMFRNDLSNWAERWERHERAAREALAGPDTPADSPPPVFPGWTALPADSQPEEPT